MADQRKQKGNEQMTDQYNALTARRRSHGPPPFPGLGAHPTESFERHHDGEDTFEERFAGDNQDRPGPPAPPPEAHPAAQRMVHDLARKAGIDAAGMIKGTQDFPAAYKQIIDAAASQAATDMEFEAVDQISKMYGVTPPWGQQRQPSPYDREGIYRPPGRQNLGGPKADDDYVYLDPVYTEMRRQGKNPGPMFGTFQRQGQMIDDGFPGAERALRPSQDAMDDYYRSRGRLPRGGEGGDPANGEGEWGGPRMDPDYDRQTHGDEFLRQFHRRAAPLENNEPGAERAYGETQNSLLRYMGRRQKSGYPRQRGPR